MSFKFGTAINCIDGRTQEPVIDFMKQKYGVDGVDMVTFPGVDGIISSSGSSGDADAIASIRNAVSISIEKHGSQVIAVVGHFDCAGNPGNREHHYTHVGKAIQQVSSWNFDAEIVGLYVNDKRQIEEVN